MAKTFEELQVWQEAMELAKKIYTVTSRQEFARDFGLRDQLRRASVSVASNIAEGFERSTRKEFIQFLFIVKGSLGEVRTQLMLAKHIGYITELDLRGLDEQGIVLARKIGRLISALRSH